MMSTYHSGEFYTENLRTWYRITPAILQGEKPAIIMLHGGPGAGHDYLLPYTRLAEYGYTVIHYDQLGCGRSSHYPRAGADFYTIEAYCQQIDALISHLKIDKFHLIGHSWGGMLALEYACRRQPLHLKSLIIASAPASIALWQKAAHQWWEELGETHRIALQQAEKSKNYQTPEVKAALEEYYRRHLGNFSPEPEVLKHSNLEMENDGHSYRVMWGENECMVTGTLKDWDITPRLHLINVPLLSICGEFDQATPITTAPFAQIKKSKFVQIPKASHVPHLENPEPTFQAICQFLADCS